MLQDCHSTPIVHIVKSETDSASKGHIICEKAATLESTMVCMANHNKGSVAEFFMGSVSQVCVTVFTRAHTHTHTFIQKCADTLLGEDTVPT